MKLYNYLYEYHSAILNSVNISHSIFFHFYTEAVVPIVKLSDDIRII